MNERVRGPLVVISGPSGVGKTTVVQRLLLEAGFQRAVTATTRAPREGEIDSVHYHFLDEDDFLREVARGKFLEYAEVYGCLYGTPRAEVERIVASGDACVLVVDVQGAATLRREGIEALFVFLTPPTWEELELRLRSRESDSDEAVELRLVEARHELDQAGEFDTVVINDDLDRATASIVDLVRESDTRDDA